jgi:hypothetical protein
MDFSQIKSFFQKIVNSGESLSKKITIAEERLLAMKKAALAREDYVAYGQESVDLIGKRYVEKLKDQANVDRQRDPLDLFSPFEFLPIGSPGPGQRHDRVSIEFLCFTFSEQIKEAWSKAVSKIEWPKEVGPLKAERLSEIKKLESEIADLHRQRDDMHRLAVDAGMNPSFIQEDPRLLSKRELSRRREEEAAADILRKEQKRKTVEKEETESARKVINPGM